MKAVEKLRILFEDESDLQALEEWLTQIDDQYRQQLLKSNDDELLKNKHQYDAALGYHRRFLKFFDR